MDQDFLNDVQNEVLKKLTILFPGETIDRLTMEVLRSGIPDLQEIINDIFEGPKKVQENRNQNVTITLDDTPPEDNISLNDTIEDIPEIIPFNEDIIDDFNVANDIAENDQANPIENGPQICSNLDQANNLLKELLPFVDFEFLEQKAAEFVNRPMADIEAYVGQVMDDPKQVPNRKDQSKAKKSPTEPVKVRSPLTVESLLKKHPNPKEHFAAKNDGDVEFGNLEPIKEKLKEAFPKHSIKKIEEVMKNNNNQYLRSYKELKITPNTLAKARKKTNSGANDQPLNESLAEEVFFAANETIVEQMIEEKANSTAVFECQCCFDDRIHLEDLITCDSGNHMFCSSCVKNGCESAIGENKSEMKCFAECQSKFSLPTLKNVLDPGIYEKYSQRLQVEEISAAGIDGLEHCPRCGSPNLCHPDDKIFRCVNEECKIETCRLCKEDNHIPLRCEEVEKDEETKNRIKLEEKMTEALIRNCYHCKTPFMKTEGCNKMDCPKCRKSMCYICKQPVTHYEHFYNGTVQPGRCPLYVDVRELHAKEVQNAAEEAKKNLGEGANLKHDPTKDLPQFQHDTNGPNTCQICGRNFPSQDIYNLHFQRQHGHLQNPGANQGTVSFTRDF